MLQPKRTKFRKQQKGRNRGLAERGSKVSFGEFGLKAVGRGRITALSVVSIRTLVKSASSVRLTMVMMNVNTNVIAVKGESTRNRSTPKSSPKTTPAARRPA